jgi:Uma2 family endonuclease
MTIAKLSLKALHRLAYKFSDRSNAKQAIAQKAYTMCTGWETGERNSSLTGQLYRWYEENEDLGKAFDHFLNSKFKIQNE